MNERKIENVEIIKIGSTKSEKELFISALLEVLHKIIEGDIYNEQHKSI